MLDEDDDDGWLIILCQGPPICSYDGSGDPALVMPCPWCGVCRPEEPFVPMVERPT